MSYSKGPMVCDICGQPFKFIRIIRVVALEDFTRIIWQGQCHNEEAHEVIPHLVRIHTRVENILSHNKDADGWDQIAEAATLREYDYYGRDLEFRRCLSVPASECTGECKACEYAVGQAAKAHRREPVEPAERLTIRDGIGLQIALQTLLVASTRGKDLQVTILEVD